MPYCGCQQSAAVNLTHTAALNCRSLPLKNDSSGFEELGEMDLNARFNFTNQLQSLFLLAHVLHFTSVSIRSQQ